MEESRQEGEQQKRGRAKTREGVVVSDKMEKTIVVAINRQVMHRGYKKFVKRTDKYLAHDERERANVGDTVRIIECRPLSKRKRWRVQRVLERGEGEIGGELE